MTNHTPQCVTYKIIAKILHMRIQSTLMEAISSDQSTFFVGEVHLEQHYFNLRNNFMG